MHARINGADLFFESRGGGRPVLLMHGGLGLDHTTLRPWHDPLARRNQLTYYDHRGNGQSARPKSFLAVDHAVWAADADGLRAHLAYERVVLLGHSYGAFLALEYALRYPARLDGLILVSAAPALDYPETVVAGATARGTEEQVATLLRAFSTPAEDDAALARFWGVVLPLYFHRYALGVGEAMLRDVRFSAAASNRSILGCLATYDVTARLRKIAVPTLIIAGRHDFVCPVVQAAERLHEGIRDSTLAVFEESAHFPFVEEPERYVDVVGDWLAQL